ncbi:MAG: hypothetical protein K2H29_08360 [Oscillospiraceae bacterium]|nr:hypothetical protein [Oscillospiraceae bacterium]
MEQKLRSKNLKSKNPVQEVLNGYYKNATVGADSISCLLGSVENTSFRKELFQQLDYYENQKHTLTAQMANYYQLPEQSVGTMAKFCSRMTIQMHKYCGLDVHESAKLMAEGTNMGMIQLHQVMNRNPDVPRAIRAQGEQILTHEREYLDRIAPYL